MLKKASNMTASPTVTKKNCDCPCHEAKLPDLVFRVKFVTEGNSPSVTVHINPDSTVRDLKEKLVQLCIQGTTNGKMQERIHSMDLFFNSKRVQEDAVVRYVVEQHYCSRRPPVGSHRKLKLGEVAEFELPVVCAHVDPCRCSSCERKMNQMVGMHNKLLWKLCFDECCRPPKPRPAEIQREPEEETVEDLELEELQDLFDQLLEEAKKSKKPK
jgi:hypothetical protein